MLEICSLIKGMTEAPINNQKQSERTGELIYSRIISYLSDLKIKYSIDSNNNIFVNINNGNKKVKYLILTGYDEPHYIVKEIDKKGFIKLSKVGNNYDFVLPGAQMVVCGKKQAFGIIAAKPPHLLTEVERETAIRLENVLLDTAIPHEELTKNVKIGDKVTYSEGLSEMINDNIIGNSLGSRACVSVLLKLTELVKVKNYEGNFHFVFTTSKENGYRDIGKILNRTQPDKVLFITADDGSGMEDNSDFKLSMGPALVINPFVNRESTEKLQAFAKAESIVHNIKVNSYQVHSPSHISQVHGLSVPSVHISVPVKYLNYSKEIICVRDFEECIKLAEGFWKANI